jgi:DNA-binding winged helix-turn-helix (wHTH) protein
MATNQTEMVELRSARACSYQFGRFTLQVENNGNMSLLSDGHAVGLTTGELTILRVLLENRGQFIKTRDLLDCVTQSPRASENIVHGAVRELRRTLHDAELIKTERSKGYCFTGEVTELPAQTSEVARANPEINPANLAATSHYGEPQPAAQTLAVTPRRRDPFLIIALLISAAVLLLPFGLAFAAGSWKNVTKQIGFIQALMILVAIGYDLFLSSAPKAADAEGQRARVALQQLRRCWRLLLASWCCLYITLLVSQELVLTPANAVNFQGQALQVITTLLNNSSALMLVLCYLVLNRPTIVRVAGRDVEDLPLIGGLCVVGGFALFEAILVGWCERFGHSDYAALVLFGSDLLSGIVGGIAMALFISRLDSRLLGATGLLPIVPIVLYFYVVIQPFYPLLNWTFPLGGEVPQHFDLWIMQLAFMLKAVMYIYVTELFKSGRFQFYMICARRVYENVGIEWDAFKRTEP